MGKIKEFLKDKAVGFYVSAAVVLLVIITAIVYVGFYGHGPREANIDGMSWWGFAFLLIAGIGGIGLGVIKQYKWIAPLVALASLWALLFFVQAIYQYVSIVLNKIDLSSFSAAFILTVVFFALTLVTSIVGIFLKQVKE